MNRSNATPLTQPGVPMKVRNVSKRFGAFTALDNVSLEVAAGELVCLLGPSGCGKTTLLRCIAGLERQDDGVLYLGSRDVSDLAPQARDYGILFQSYALFPNLTVEANIAYGLAGSNRDVVRKRVSEMLELVGLTGSEKKFPGQLSGGQQQRVALARALAPAPSLLLLDEPMSALDARVREHLCTELRQLQRNKVVLPHPEGPSRHTSSPAATSSETLSSAVKAPKRLLTLRTFIGTPGWVKAVAFEWFMDAPHQADGGHPRGTMRTRCGSKAKAADSGIGEFWYGCRVIVGAGLLAMALPRFA